MTKSEKWRLARDARRRAGWAEANKPPRVAKRTKPLGRVPQVMGKIGQSYHPVREIEVFFHKLSDRGMAAALDLKFGPMRKRGSAESLRARPRGLPGTGRAGMLPRPELLARIAGLRAYIGVKQYV